MGLDGHQAGLDALTQDTDPGPQWQGHGPQSRVSSSSGVRESRKVWGHSGHQELRPVDNYRAATTPAIR